MKRPFPRVLKAGALLLTASFLSCTEPAVEKPPPRPVYTIVAPERTTSVQRSFTGSLRAARGAALSFQVAGRLVSLPAKAGRRFREKQVLARIDCTQYEAELLDARAQFKRSTEDLRRTQSLFETGNASKQDLDNALAARTSAKARLDSAMERVSDCTLVMPYAGVIGGVDVEVEQTVSPGSPVLSIQGEEGMEMLIGVPENEIREFRIGMSGRILLQAVQGKEFPGAVSEISQRVSKGGTYEVKVKLEEVNFSMRDGMSGEAIFDFETSTTGVINIPFECVVGGPRGQRHVWVVVKEGNSPVGLVQRREVEVGEIVAGGRIQVRHGLDPGELVVTRGVHRLEAGTTVTLLKK